MASVTFVRIFGNVRRYMSFFLGNVASALNHTVDDCEFYEAPATMMAHILLIKFSFTCYDPQLLHNDPKRISVFEVTVDSLSSNYWLHNCDAV